MSNFKIHNPDQRALAHLKQRFPHIDTVERLLAEAHLRLSEVIDGTSVWTDKPVPCGLLP